MEQKQVTSMDIGSDAPSSGMKNTGGDRVRSGLLKTNHLDYRLKPDLSVAVEKRIIKQWAQNQIFTEGNLLTFQLSSGADFVDFSNSWLSFNIRITSGEANTKYNFGGRSNDAGVAQDSLVGSCLNLFERVQIESRDGSEICRIDNFNVLAAHALFLKHDQQYYNTVAKTELIGSTWSDGLDVASGNVRVVIPMRRLCGFFAYDKLTPSMVASGMKITIQLARANQAFCGTKANGVLATTTSPLQYELNDCYLQLQSYRLTDSIVKSLMQLSSTQGLELVWSEYWHTRGTSNQESVNLEVRKAVSRALGSVVIPRRTDSDGDVRYNSFASPWAITQHQWRCGSTFFPQAPISASSSAGTKFESYYYLLDSLHRTKCGRTPKLTLQDFTDSCGISSCDLERSAVLSLAGLPINNSRTLTFQGKLEPVPDRTTPTNPATEQGRLYDFFLSYVTLARVFLNNIEVEI